MMRLGSSPVRNETVLVVDDSNTMRTVLSQGLQEIGFQVESAEDGYAAIRKLKGKHYDLMTLDIEMPGLGGIEVLRIAKRLDPDLCVLMITSLNTLKIALDAIRTGAYDYITKPFNIDEVVLTAERGLESKRLRRENQRLLQNLQEINRHLEAKVRERTAELEQSKEKVEEYAGKLEEANRELKLTNRRLEEANQELQELDRLKSEFITIASHELRTPLVAIQGYTNIILNERLGSLHSRQKKGLQVAETNIKRLASLVNDLLDIARLDSDKLPLKFERFSVDGLLRQMAGEVLTLVEMRNQTFQLVPTEPEGAETLVLADRERIIQVINNLIFNAIRFTPDGGHIEMGCRDLEDEVEVFIRDNGIGISRRYHEKIFEPFFEVQSSDYHSSGSLEFRSGGSGVGLSIVKGILQEHEGHIWVESEEAAGATFRFLLPVDGPRRAQS